MGAARYDWNPIKAGETWTRAIFAKNEDGSPKNLAGYSARMHIRHMLEGPLAHELSTASGGGITIEGTAGKITLHLAAAKTAELYSACPSRAVYDLWLYDPSNNAIPLLEGEITFVGSVTR